MARQLDVHRRAGRRHLLTEDVLRMCAVLALERVGVEPSALHIEVAEPSLRGGKVDLVVTGTERRTVIEFKYPRGAHSGMSPDTMTMGEVLRDFLRVAVADATGRWVVIALAPVLNGYLRRRLAQVWVDDPGQELVLERDMLEALPKTARAAIGPVPWLLPVRAKIVVATPVDDDLTLLAYQVEAPAAGGVPAPLAEVSTSAGTAAHGGATQVESRTPPDPGRSDQGFGVV